MIGVNTHQSLFAMVKDQSENRMSVSHRKTMSLLSRSIEITALKATGPVRVFSSFQTMQFFMPVLNRYTKLAQRAKVFVYGYPDVIPPLDTGITYVRLDEDDPLVKEWFVVVNSPDFCIALVTEDEAGLNVPHERRRFKGLLTCERDTIQQLDDALSRQINIPTIEKMNTSLGHRSLVMEMVGNLQDASRRVKNDPFLMRELAHLINQYISPVLS